MPPGPFHPPVGLRHGPRGARHGVLRADRGGPRGPRDETRGAVRDCAMKNGASRAPSLLLMVEVGGIELLRFSGLP